MADHSTESSVEIITKAALSRAWNDVEPKVLAWLSGGGLLTAASIVYGYAFPDSPVPFWVPLVVTWLGGFAIAYLKRSTVKTPAVSDLVAQAAQAGIVPTITSVGVNPTLGLSKLPAPDLGEDDDAS